MDEPPRVQQREFYRLWYPVAERPKLRIGDQEFDVSEVSEAGARIVISAPVGLSDSEAFTGTIKFRTGETDSGEGKILRSSENEIVAELTTGISLKRMMAEQIRIRQKYPPVAGES
ncbi:MAG: PilZ domain-containing protein [Planctomycetales bacterium]|jgi:hypothetical protein